MFFIGRSVDAPCPSSLFQRQGPSTESLHLKHVRSFGCLNMHRMFALCVYRAPLVHVCARTYMQTHTKQVIVDDGAILSAALNAATMALLNAGVEMTGIALSVTCCITSSVAGRYLLLDPCKSEEGEAAATVATATLSAGGGVLSCRAVGLMSREEYFACCEAAALGTTAVRSFVRLSAEQKVNREAETLR